MSRVQCGYFSDEVRLFFRRTAAKKPCRFGYWAGIYTYLAGLYRIEEKGDLKYPVFTVLTRDPAEEIRFIHDRMPLILPSDSVRSWIKPDGNPKEILDSALTDMVFEKIG